MKLWCMKKNAPCCLNTCVMCATRHSVSVTAFLLDAHGHQPKVWQSCGDGTHGGVSDTPRMYWNGTDVCIKMRDRWKTTKMPLTFEDSRLWPQGCSRHVTTSVCFEWSEPLEVPKNRTPLPGCAAPFIVKGHMTHHACAPWCHSWHHYATGCYVMKHVTSQWCTSGTARSPMHWTRKT